MLTAEFRTEKVSDRITRIYAFSTELNPEHIWRNSAEVNPYAVLSEDEILERLSTVRTHSAQGKQREAKAAISEMRSK